MVHGPRSFNAAFTRAESTKFLVVVPISLMTILMLSSHLRLGLPKGPVGLPVTILKALLTSSILATCPAISIF